MHEIMSRQNAIFANLEKWLETKHSRRDRVCIASGRKIVPELLRDFPERIRHIIFQKSKHTQYSDLNETQNTSPKARQGDHRENDRESSQENNKENNQWRTQFEKISSIKRSSAQESPLLLSLTADLFHSLDTEGTDFPLVAIEIPEFKPWPALNGQLRSNSTATQHHEILLSMSNPANLGAAIRSARAFDINHFVLLKEAVWPFHPKAIRGSSGLVFSSELYAGPSISELNDFAENIIALDSSPEAIDISEINWPKNVSLLVGQEGPGLPNHNFKKTNIKISKSVESLNASVAVALACYEISKAKKV
jgi:RNA methyltransferase, TrmH family